jgi:hypothetical protein
MPDNPNETDESNVGAPAPEVLKAQSDDASATPEEPSVVSPEAPKPVNPRRRGTYRPSHKATFIGLGVIAIILAINVVIVTFVINGQNSASTTNNTGSVTLSSSALDKLGVSRNTVGDSGEKLVVGPDAQFNGKVTIAKDVSVGGALTLNGKLITTNGSITNLQAGNTSVSQLDVNGNATATNLNLRSNLTVVGTSILQGAVTVGQLLTVNNNLTVVGNVAVGGTLSARNFEASSLTSDTTLTIGGHIITSGSVPGSSKGSALRSTDTASVSGNDASGTVQVNIGVGSIGAGSLIQINFINKYSNTPHVVVMPVGASPGSIFVNRNSTGFNIDTASGLSAGTYVFDYIIVQ